ncbi:MAG: hypothetical protein DBY36_07745 [Clostridiales bacterium]|nr:MAG: hypothetical protein DBY36_07745 [Clostridiales bacterium]
MAAATVTTKKLKWNEADSVTLATADATDGAYVTPANDEATVLILTASAALTATVKAGDGIQGVADLEVSMTNGATKYLSVESGRYKITSGPNAGKILVKTSAAGLTVGCLALPR